MKAQSGNPLGTLLALFLVFFVFAIGGYLSLTFLNIIPHSNAGYTVANTIYNATFKFFDKSFFFIAILILFIDVVVSALNPSRAKGVTNILMLFGVSFIGLFLYTNLPTFNQVLSANAILPDTYAFLSSNYLIPLIYFFLVLCTVLNFRRVNGDNAVATGDTE